MAGFFPNGGDPFTGFLNAFATGTDQNNRRGRGVDHFDVGDAPDFFPWADASWHPWAFPGQQRGGRHRGRRGRQQWHTGPNFGHRFWTSDEDDVAGAAPGATPWGPNAATAETVPTDEASTAGQRTPSVSTTDTVMNEKEGSEVPDPAEVAPEEEEPAPGAHNGPWGAGERCGPQGPHCPGRHGFGGRGRGRGRGFFPGPGRGPHHGRHGHGHGHGHGPHHHPPPPHHGPNDPFGPHPGRQAPNDNFDLAGLFTSLAQHPVIQNLQSYVSDGVQAHTQSQQEQPKDNKNVDTESSFSPPVDVFDTEHAYVLHAALPGARKEDIGVDWDQDAGILRIAGVVHRPGDETFLRSLASGERRVGMFERSITLPPLSSSVSSQQQQQQRGEIDALAISARMEDGILIVTVPKMEKEWTEIRKVDIQ